MSKKFAKATLMLFYHAELLQIAKQWNIKEPAKEKLKLVEQIYGHQQNQIIKFSIYSSQDPKSECGATHETCIRFNCAKHPQATTKLALDQCYKKTPTNFFRFPLPICWFVSGTQFLSAINWPLIFRQFSSTKSTHHFARLYNLINIAKLDISGNTFKCAPGAARFIKIFKTKLGKQEED